MIAKSTIMYKCDIILSIKSTIHGYIKSNHFICHITNSTCAVESEKLGSVLQTVQNTIDTFNK